MDIKNPIIFFSLLILSNAIAYALNILISKLWNKVINFDTTISKKEILSSLLTLFTVIVVAVPGFLLWHKGIITFSDSNLWITFIGLFFLIDFMMYILHWVSHNMISLKKIHAIHHEHSKQFNCVSLYYMSPLESILFGALLTIIAIFFNLNMYGFILFLIFNWLYGVIAHLNINTKRSTFLIFTTNFFHLKHHMTNDKNYGFYTFIWDKVFGTEEKRSI
ncbi:sterol desaturase family protein [Flavobacteriaceae bacterium]|nr:sterol desaturase family protein [Flavobacteriaceae bacterium]